MKLNISFTLFFLLTSCLHENQQSPKNAKATGENKDTILVRHQKVLKESYEVELFSKSITYYWMAGNDTIDFFVNVSEYVKDSTLGIRIHHKEPVLFTTSLHYINKSLPEIKNDFDITKLNSIYLKPLIYYLDLTKELSIEYEQKFGRKNISYQKLNEFLLGSNLNNQLNHFLKPLNKKVKRYSIEKFHLWDKKSFSFYTDWDLKDYPEFAIGGMGVSVYLENK